MRCGNMSIMRLRVESSAKADACNLTKSMLLNHCHVSNPTLRKKSGSVVEASGNANFYSLSSIPIC